MEKVEMVEKLQQKANVSLEEARTVLEQCDWDLLDALIRLEKEGKLKAPAAHGSSVREELACAKTPAEEKDGKTAKDDPGESGWTRFCRFVKKLVRKSIDNRFVVKHNGSVIIDVPVLVAVILMVAFFWLTVILLAVGLFTHCEYSFTGADLGKDSINGEIRKATDAAQNFADQIKKG